VKRTIEIDTDETKAAWGVFDVSQKNVPPLTCYNLDIHGSIIFGTHVTEKVGSQNVLYFPSSPN